MLRLALVALAVTPMIGATPSVAAGCTGRWTELPSPATHAPEGIEALAEDDAWLVAYSTNAEGEDQGHSYHWDGVAWTKVAIPQPGVSEYVWGIGAVAPSDVWIVGQWQENVTYESHAYAAHWDGTRFVQTPVDAGRSARLFDADGVAGDDVWTVGFHFADGEYRSLAMHWDGASWTEVAAPGPTRASTYLWDVDVLAIDDVWAVGSIYGRRKGGRPLALHWDGATWTRSRLVVPPGNWSYFSGVAATGPNEVWAVGSSDNGAHPLIERWDGTRWRTVPGPDGGSGTLDAVSVVSRREAWAVGRADGGMGPTLLRWNGSGWRSVDVPGGRRHGALSDVVSLPDGTSFAVGFNGAGILPLQRCLTA